MKTKKAFFSIILILLMNCNPESLTVNTNQYKGKGTIHRATNTYVIDTDDGRKFLPTNLSEEFKVNNVRVEFEGTIEKDNTLPPNLEIIRLMSIKKI